MTRTARVSTDLPINADFAFSLAHELRLFEYVVWPVLRISLSEQERATAARPEELTVGQKIAGRLWFLQIIPAWRHEIEIVGDGLVADGRFELYTNERSGPIRRWNHRLTFEQTGPQRCRYTDEIEISAPMPLMPATLIFTRLLFRYRQWRWRRLTGRQASTG